MTIEPTVQEIQEIARKLVGEPENVLINPDTKHSFIYTVIYSFEQSGLRWSDMRKRGKSLGIQVLAMGGDDLGDWVDFILPDNYADR